MYVANNSEGLLKLASISSFYNLQTPKEITSLFSENGLELLKLHLIAVFSGAGYDGLAAVVDVDELSSKEVQSGLYGVILKSWG